MTMSTGRVVALIQAMGGGADPAVIEQAVQDWLDAHPEATTTVQDGSITEQKLATSIAQKLGLISSLSDEIDDIGSDVTDLKSAFIGSKNVFTVSSAGTKRFSANIKHGDTCVYTNNTSAAITVYVYKSDGTSKSIHGGLTPGKSITFISDADYTQIGGYFNASGTVTFEIIGTSQVTYRATIDKNQEYGLLQKITNVGAVSSLTVIGAKLFVFSYVSTNTSSTGKIYSIDESGLLYADGDTFTSNIGHQNTVDYSSGNKCLICSRYTINDVTDFSVYILQNVTDATRSFDITGDNAIKYDMSNITGIGNTKLNAIWGENDYNKYDIIYVFSEDSETQKQYWTKIQLGRGSNNLGLGAYVSGKSGNQFNGSFKIVRTYELPHIEDIYEAINDGCFYKGKIYRCPVHSFNGWAYIEETFEMYNTEIADKRNLIEIPTAEGQLVNQETEGIAIHNGYLYIGSYGNGIAVFKV